MLACSVVDDPGVQGAEVAGMHGIGVSTPRAAAVAAATVGLDALEHIPNVATLVIGAKSMIVAAGIPPAMTVGALLATSAHGAAPNEQLIIAPDTTWFGIVCSGSRGVGTMLPRRTPDAQP